MTEFKKSTSNLESNRAELQSLLQLSPRTCNAHQTLLRIAALRAELEKRAQEAQMFGKRSEELVLAPSGERVPRFNEGMKAKVALHIAGIEALLQDAKATLGSLESRLAERQILEQEQAQEQARLEQRLQGEQAELLVRAQQEAAANARREETERAQRQAQAVSQAVKTVLELERNPLQEEATKLAGKPRGKQALVESRRLLDAKSAKALREICTNIQSKPENEIFRTLKLSNDHVRELLARPGVTYFLYALGFNVVEVDEGASLAYKLAEPDIEHDFDAWGRWFELIKESIEVLKANPS